MKSSKTVFKPNSSKKCLQLQSMKYIDAYTASRYYLYEYDDNLEIVNIPRQILPYAIVEFKVKSDGSKDARHPVPRPVPHSTREQQPYVVIVSVKITARKYSPRTL